MAGAAGGRHHRALALGRGERRSGRSTTDDPALRLLRERCARGEIDLEEFEERRKHLRG